MFGKLKEKLKGALAVFSKKADESTLPHSLPDKQAVGNDTSSKSSTKIQQTTSAVPTTGKSTASDEPLRADAKTKETLAKSAERTTKKPLVEKVETIKNKPLVESAEAKSKKLLPQGVDNNINKTSDENTDARTESVAKSADLNARESSIPIADAPKKGFFAKVKESLTTKKISQKKFEELFWDLELALLENNVSVEVIEKIKEDLGEALVDVALPRDVAQVLRETLARSVRSILTQETVDIVAACKTHQPLVIAFFGINGVGKTTSLAKVAAYLQKHNKTVVMAACDTFRAAAIQQLEAHGTALGCKVIKHDYGSDAAAVAFDAILYAKKQNKDVVLIDTAGRLHSNTNLMGELEKIIRVTKPHVKIFVGESITGNDCIEQATRFNDLVQLDGAILTKVDVDDKGGAPLSIAFTIKKPILFFGTGQTYADLELFSTENMIERLGLES